VTTAFDLAFGTLICVLYGFAAMAALEELLKTSRWMGGRRRPDGGPVLRILRVSVQ
jgi:hypothetical protein